MARLKFQNVPSPSGGVMSGNVSIASGSPFGKGGEHAGKIAHVQSEIAKKPKGYYDPQQSFNIQSNTIDDFFGLHLNDFESLESNRLNEAYWNTRRDDEKARLKGLLDEARQKEKNAQADAHMQGVLARLQNGELVAPAYFQNNIIQAQTGIISSEQFLTVYQNFVKNGTIHKPIVIEKPVPAPATPAPEPEPTPPAVTSSFPIIPIIIIAVIVGFFLLRRRA